jgi:carbamoyltransferase
MGMVQAYESATTLIGQDPLENGKTMGLSAYGDKENVTPDLFYENIVNDSKFLFCGKGETVLNVNNKHNFTKEVTRDNHKLYADYALSVQLQTQEVVGNLIEKYIKKTDTKNVCITGGYGFNVVCNQYLTDRFPDLEFYFEPLADDSGNSIGAANYVCRTATQISDVIPLTHTFFNHVEPSIPSNIGESVTVEQIAEHLKEGKIIAMFKGQAEAGPRSLGNRSILFDARVKNGKQIINNIKRREWYRPFACSVLEEDANKYFDMGRTIKSPFMTSSFNIRPEHKDSFPAITHVDGTCRIQTVDKSVPHFKEILEKFKDITGTGMLLNTSFNLAGEPLVDSFEDAIRTCNSTEIDYLWLPDKEVLLKFS